MKTLFFRNRAVLAAAALAVGAVSSVHAGPVGQSTREASQSWAQQRAANERSNANNKARETNQRESNKQSTQVDVLFPEATRREPPKTSTRASSKLKKMLNLYHEDKGPDARAIAEELIASEKASPYEKAYAAQIAAQVAYDADDAETAVAYYQQAIALDSLDNNSHYSAMLNLAQLQQQQEQYPQSLATYERFFNETKSAKPEYLIMKGQGLYLMERYPEAAAVMEQAIAAGPEPKSQWLSLLMQVYMEDGNTTKALELAQRVAASAPEDKRAQLNLAVAYQQNEMGEEAAELLEKLRASGKLSEENEYRQLYSTYLNLEDHEKEAVEVINEGLEKGLLKPDFQTQIALAQAYYFSDQFGLAIDAYKTAAPLDDDGETYLNLARALWQEDRIPEAKAAAKQAIGKGLKKPDDAKKILALPGG